MASKSKTKGEAKIHKLMKEPKEGARKSMPWPI